MLNFLSTQIAGILIGIIVGRAFLNAKYGCLFLIYCLLVVVVTGLVVPLAIFNITQQTSSQKVLFVGISLIVIAISGVVVSNITSKKNISPLLLSFGLGFFLIITAFVA